MTDIEAQLVDRKVWLAASTHAEEEEGMHDYPTPQKNVNLLEIMCNGTFLFLLIRCSWTL